MVDQNTGPALSPLEHKIAAGMDLIREGRFGEAVKHTTELLAANPGNPQVLLLAGEVRLAAGDPAGALPLVTAANAAAPGQPPLMLKLAHVLLMLRRRKDACTLAAEAANIARKDGRALWALSKIAANAGEPGQARDLLEQALGTGFTHPALLYDLAAALFFLGEFDAAKARLETLLAMAPKAGAALYLRSTLRPATEADNHVADLESRLADGFVEPASEASCLFALAKELEDLGQDARSIEVLNRAAALKHSSLRHDPAGELAAIDSIRGAWTAEVTARDLPGHDEEGAIFIVGMPRTGTTLVERMLGRQGEVGEAGELLDFGQLLATAAQRIAVKQPELGLAEASTRIDFAALGREYMAGLRQAAPGHRFVIDKMPINYMYCGMIRKALPRARIIHLVRDPMDTGYAVYKTMFHQAYPFSYDQAELADYYAAYRRLMQHWHEVMPDEILDVHYEQLVADPAGQARRILAFCGLAWNDDVLAPEANARPAASASAAQVRQPVHTGSIGKWRRYADGLQVLKARMAEHGFATD